MKILQDSQQFLSTEHLVLSVGEEGVCLNSKYQIEDFIINSPEGEVLIAWNSEIDPEKSFPDNACFSIPGKPDLKEVSNVDCTKIAMKSVKGTIKVYLTLQRN